MMRRHPAAEGLRCLAGQQPALNGQRCETCPSNTIKAARNNLPCTPCPAGTFTAGDQRKDRTRRGNCLPGVSCVRSAH